MPRGYRWVWVLCGALLLSFAPTARAADEASGFDPLTMSPDEMKLRLAPLTLDELKDVRMGMVEALRAHAEKLANQLVEHYRLEHSAETDAEALAELQKTLDDLFETKADLISRTNIVLAAMEAKGGDVAADRAYVGAVDQLVQETAPQAEPAPELTDEERQKAATRGRVAELVAVVRAEPPVHERPKPWEIPVSELELELQPLTLEEIETRLKAWQDILQREVRKRVRYDILLLNAERLASPREDRPDASLTGGVPEQGGDSVSMEAIKAELAAESQAQQQVVLAIVERMNAAINLVRKRGGDADAYVDYIASATGQKLNLYDPTVLYAQIRAWLMSPNGGLNIGLNIVKFIGVLIAFWILSLILGWLTRAGLGRLPRASSLLKPLLVATVKRVTMFVGFITAVTMLGVNPGPLLAMIGAAGLVIGLALQGTLSNFASGILILVNRPFDVGDVINAGGVFGKVEAMNLVSTQVLTFDNQIMFVPNNEIWNNVITNVTGRDTRRVDMTFGISYADDISKATAILEEVISAHPKVLSDPAPMVRVHELGDNSVNFIARPWSRTADYWDVYWDLTREVKQRFDAEGINIPFPQRDLHVPGQIQVVLAGKD